MEKIERIDGNIYYGDKLCSSVDAAYVLFRDDYNKSVGKRAYERLSRLGSRTERIHGQGFDFTNEYSEYLAEQFKGYGRVECIIMGMVGIAYCNMISTEAAYDLEEDAFWKWVDWVFDKRSHALKMIRRRDGAGRTSKRLKRRYR